MKHIKAFLAFFGSFRWPEYKRLLKNLLTALVITAFVYGFNWILKWQQISIWFVISYVITFMLFELVGIWYDRRQQKKQKLQDQKM